MLWHWLQLVHMRYICGHSCLVTAHELIGICGIYGILGAYFILGHILQRMLKKSWSLLFKTYMCSTLAFIFRLHQEYSWDIYLWCGRHICLGAYTNAVNYMYISVPCMITDCSGFIWGIYTGIVVSYLHMTLLAQVAYVVFEGHISFWEMHGNNVFPVTWFWWCHQCYHCICHV